MVEINPVQLIVSLPGSGMVSPPSELIRSSTRDVETLSIVAVARGRNLEAEAESEAEDRRR